jgi:hypothetical protein
MYQYTKLMAHIEKWVDQVDSPELNRSWEIVKESLSAHATVDREPTESAKLARASAWSDWADGYKGEDSTFALVGLVHEFTSAVPDEASDELDVIMQEAMDLAEGHKPAKRVKQRRIETKVGQPELTLIVTDKEGTTDE